MIGAKSAKTILLTANELLIINGGGGCYCLKKHVWEINGWEETAEGCAAKCGVLRYFFRSGNYWDNFPIGVGAGGKMGC